MLKESVIINLFNTTCQNIARKPIDQSIVVNYALAYAFGQVLEYSDEKIEKTIENFGSMYQGG